MPNRPSDALLIVDLEKDSLSHGEKKSQTRF